MSEEDTIKITRLGDSIKSPCYLLYFNDVYILLDCPIDLSVLRNFVPNHPLVKKGASSIPSFEKTCLNEKVNLVKINNQTYFDSEFKLGFIKKSKLEEINLESIDVILISNCYTMLGLPFILNNKNFQGRVYATEPTALFGRIMMMDMLKLVQRLGSDTKELNVDSEEFLGLEGTIPFCDTDVTGWYDMYTEESIKNCMTRINFVSFDQPIDLFGLLEVQGICSGFTIGSCNWIISNKFEKIAYMSHSSGIVSHSSPLEIQKLKGVDIMLIGTCIIENLLSIEKMCDEMCSKMCETLKRCGHVIIPINCCGVFFDLIEKVYLELTKNDLSHIQMFVLGSQSKASLATANIYGEWLNKQRESQLYNADYPFIFEKLIKSDVLIPCEDLGGIFSQICRKPSIVFVTHPSLRMGDVVHLIRTWGKDPNNGLFLVDTENYNLPLKKELYKHVMDRIMAPFGDLEMSVHYYPLEIRLKAHELPGIFDQIASPTQAILVPIEASNMNRILFTKFPDNIRKIELEVDQVIELDPFFNKDSPEIRHNQFNQEIQLSYSLIEQLRPITIRSNINTDGSQLNNTDQTTLPQPPQSTTDCLEETNICLVDANIIYRDGKYTLCTPSEMYQPTKPIQINKPDQLNNQLNGCTNGGIVSNTNSTNVTNTNVTGSNMTDSYLASMEKKMNRIFGKLNIDNLMNQLKMKGCTNFKLETYDDGKPQLIVFTDEDALIHISENNTHVLCENEDTRKKIRDAIIATFTVLNI